VADRFQVKVTYRPAGTKSPTVWLAALFLLCTAICGSSQSRSPSAAAGGLSTALPEACETPAASGNTPAPPPRTLALHPTAAVYNVWGTYYAQSNNLRCAIPAFEAGLALDPKAWEIRYNLALALIRTRDFSRAVTELRRVIAEKPDSSKAHNALGLALESLGQADAASEEFTAAVHIDPHFASALYNLGHLLYSQRRYDGSIYYFRQALSASPPAPLDRQIKIELAGIYAEKQDYSDSIRLFQTLVAAQPHSAPLHFDLANVYAHNKQFPEAASEYQKVLEIDPANASAMLSLAKALMTLYQVRQALPYLRGYTKIRPGDAEGYEILGEAFKYSGQFDAAATALRRAVEMDPSNYEAHYNLGFVLERSGHLQEAIDQLREAKKLKPNGSEALYELGIALTKQNQREAAQQEFQQFQTVKKAGQLDTVAGVADRQASADFGQGRVDEAVKAYQKALQFEPGNAKIHYNLSLALAKAGDHEREERELERAVKLDPRLAPAHNQLGLCYLADGRLSDSERELKAALEADPGYAEAEGNLGVLYGREGKDSEAISRFRQATTDNPQYAQAYFNWGLILAAQARYGEAREKLLKAVAVAPDYADAYQALGMVELKQGKTNAADADFQKAAAIRKAAGGRR
jgi:superkiller protein 3